MSAVVLTLWEKRHGLFPTRGAEERLEEPTAGEFDAAVLRLLGSVTEASTPFQIVAQMGHSSRGFQLGQGWSDVRVANELWTGYLGLKGVNG